MFESIRTALNEQINTCVETVASSELIRAHLDALAVGAIPPSRFEDNLRKIAPARKPWLIYDHCAALTRIYSVLEIFISSLTKEICAVLPETSNKFSALPERTRTAYRKGYAKILVDLKEKHHFQNIDLSKISRTVNEGFCDEQPYRLSPEPFLANKRAFRLPQIQSHLLDLGFINIESSFISHHAIRRITANHDEGESLYDCMKRKLNDFINARNDAAHTDVTAIWPHQKIRDAAYLIRDLCISVLDICEEQLLASRLARNLLVELGRVTELHSSRKGIIFTPVACQLRASTEIIMVRDSICSLTMIRSLHVDGNSHHFYSFDGRTEAGLLLGVNSNLGDRVYVLPEVVIAMPLPFMIEDFENDETLDAERDDDLDDQELDLEGIFVSTEETVNAVAAEVASTQEAIPIASEASPTDL